jgi:hypothetical protein
MNEISNAMRARLMDTLELISSEKSQREYQNAVPSVDVPAELFNQWEDCFFSDDVSFRGAFSADEFEALDRFDSILNEICDETPKNLPALNEFIKTAWWQRLSHEASVALAALKKPF